jgi:hypothetical protein
MMKEVDHIDLENLPAPRVPSLAPLAVGIADGARMIGLSKRQTENYIALKLPPSKKIGRRRILLVKDLAKFLASDKPSASTRVGK